MKTVRTRGLRRLLALFLIDLEVVAQPTDHVIFVPFLQFFLNFFEREMDNIVVVHLQGRHRVTEAQPQPVQKIDFVGGEVRCVGAEDFVKLVPVGHVNFQVELRLGIGEVLPRITELTGLLLGGLS